MERAAEGWLSHHEDPECPGATAPGQQQQWAGPSPSLLVGQAGALSLSRPVRYAGNTYAIEV